MLTQTHISLLIPHAHIYMHWNITLELQLDMYACKMITSFQEDTKQSE